MFSHAVPAGFPSPADDYVEDVLDLNKLLIQNKPATFFLRVKGDSMINAGIHDGDIIVVEPWFKLKDLARKHGIVALSSNYALYADMSNRVMTVLRDFSPRQEVYRRPCGTSARGL